MRDNSNNDFYFQGWKDRRAAGTPQPYQPTQQESRSWIEEMVQPSLHPLFAESKEVYTEEFVAPARRLTKEFQTRPVQSSDTEISSSSPAPEQFLEPLNSGSQNTDDWTSLSSTDLLPLLFSADFHIRANAIRRAKLLAQPVLAHILSALQQALNQPQSDIRIFALQALGSLNRTEQFSVFSRALCDPSWQVRTTAVRELGKLGSDAPRALLIEALDDPDVSVRDAAIWALKPLAVWAWEERNDRQPINALVDALHDESELIRAAAAETTGDFNWYIPTVELVERLRNDKSELVRAAAAEALGKLRSSLPDEELLHVLHHDKSAIVRAAAAEALGNLREFMPVGELLHVLLHDKSAIVRAAGVKSLGLLGESTPYEALEALIFSLKDHAEEVREQARTSLGKLHEQIYERASLPFLFSLLRDECADVRLLAAWALGERRERAAREPLKDTLLDSNLAVQDAAIWALEQLAKYPLLPDGTFFSSKPTASSPVEAISEDEQNIGNRFEKDLFLSLVDFVKGKKGFIKAETRDEHVLVLKCYFQKEEKSLQEAVLSHRQGASSVQHLEKALRANDTMVQDLARYALRKREWRRWTETFLVSLDLTQADGQRLVDDIPARIIVCSIAYHQVRANDLSICHSIDQYVKENRGLLIYERACEWLERCKEPIFRYACGVSDIKVWYDSVTSPAHP